MPPRPPAGRAPSGRRRRRGVVLTLVLLLPAWVLPASAARPTAPPAPTAPVPDEAGLLERPPVDGVVGARFRAPEHPWSPGHRGIDLVASPGDVVRSPAAGVVTFADVVVDRPVVTVTHAGGLRSSLEPVTATVDVGTPVTAGEAVGTLGPGPDHCAAGSCLHWGVRRGDVYLDPLDLLPGSGPVVLLPVTKSGRRDRRLRRARSP